MGDASPIVFEDVRKEYGSFVAVDGLSLEIKRNSFTGLLGPNGAGKSTSLKILTNLIHATSGSARLNGIDVGEDPKNALYGVGTVVETPEFYLYMTPCETFRYVGEIFGMSKESISSETSTILDKVKMTEWGDKKLGTFSKGMRQRISIGIALMNDPRIIVLDEPTSGLDPRGMSEMREILKNIRNENNDLTVLMSSHMMHEVNDLCDRVAMVNHGKLLVHDDLMHVIEKDNVRTLVVKTSSPVGDDIIAGIGRLDNVVGSKRSGSDIEIRFEGTYDDESRLFNSLADMDVGVYNLFEGNNMLEERYLDLIKESR